MAELCVGSLRDVEMAIEHWMRDQIGHESKMATSSRAWRKRRMIGKEKSDNCKVDQTSETGGDYLSKDLEAPR